MTQKVIVYRNQYEQRVDDALMNGGFEIFLVIMLCALLSGITVIIAARMFPKYRNTLRGHQYGQTWLCCIFVVYLFIAHWIANG